MAKRIEPKLAKGMRDIVGPPIRRRQAMLDTIRVVFERFGFQPLETPAIEFAEVLTGAKAGEIECEPSDAVVPHIEGAHLAVVDKPIVFARSR